MTTNTKIEVIFLCLLLLIIATSASASAKSQTVCNSLTFYFHDILYNGENEKNCTSVIVAAPAWGNGNLTALAQPPNFFGNIVVFNDPITLDNNLNSPPVGRAQGSYLYDGKDKFAAKLDFYFFFNSTKHVGTIIFSGADPINKTRDISVIGGTGDFFMARGIATLTTDDVEGEAYFRLKVDIKMYECY